MIGISWHFGSFSFLVKSKLNWCSLGGNPIRIARVMCLLHNMSPLATVALQEDRYFRGFVKGQVQNRHLGCFCVDNVKRACILTNWLGMKG